MDLIFTGITFILAKSQPLLVALGLGSSIMGIQLAALLAIALSAAAIIASVSLVIYSFKKMNKEPLAPESEIESESEVEQSEPEIEPELEPELEPEPEPKPEIELKPELLPSMDDKQLQLYPKEFLEGCVANNIDIKQFPCWKRNRSANTLIDKSELQGSVVVTGDSQGNPFISWVEGSLEDSKVCALFQIEQNFFGGPPMKLWCYIQGDSGQTIKEPSEYAAIAKSLANVLNVPAPDANDEEAAPRSPKNR